MISANRLIYHLNTNNPLLHIIRVNNIMRLIHRNHYYSDISINHTRRATRLAVHIVKVTVHTHFRNFRHSIRIGLIYLHRHGILSKTIHGPSPTTLSSYLTTNVVRLNRLFERGLFRLLLTNRFNPYNSINLSTILGTLPPQSSRNMLLYHMCNNLLLTIYTNHNTNLHISILIRRRLALFKIRLHCQRGEQFIHMFSLRI